ncbi:MAG: TrkH family potassium uptake protein [Clostridia bacterium]|nr:TrkH family potassium uptake protein [Clostridia bacterium]
MNWKSVAKVLGKVLIAEAVMLLLPLIVAAIYGETTYWGFLIPALALVALATPTFFIRTRDEETNIYAKEGFAIVAFAWLIMSLIGALPFVITKAIPHYLDAVFETISGFTTTGASILPAVEGLPFSVLFWRSFTNWIGGMGVLVFVLAVLPKNNNGIMYAFRAEATGPSVGKIVSKMAKTARILYGIYIGLTVIEMIFLIAGKMPVFDGITTALANAGTGGFSVRNASIAAYNSLYIEIVVTVFMFLFSVNFNLYFLILTGHFLKALKNEESLAFIGLVVAAILIVAVNLVTSSVETITNFGTALRYSSFQVLSLGSTTGFSSIDYNDWPTLSKVILLFLMLIGGMAGSTAGGIKMSRFLILTKSTAADIRRMVHPREIVTVKLEGEPVNAQTITNVRIYFVTWVAIFILCGLLISIEEYGDFLTNFSASISCISNIGPGFNLVGPAANFSGYSYFSKVVLSIEMLFGRLEIFPLIVLFSPATYRK